MGPFAPKQSDKHFDKKDAVACVKSWQFWAFAVAYFCFANSLNAAGCACLSPLGSSQGCVGTDYRRADFIPTIVQSLGFQGAKAQLLTVPPNAFAAIASLHPPIFSRFLSIPSHTCPDA